MRGLIGRGELLLSLDFLDDYDFELSLFDILMVGFRSLKDLSGIGRKMPLTSIMLLIAALSFSGSPPFAGLLAKYLVFTSAIESNLAWLAIIGILTSVLQSAYFLRLIGYMFAKRNETGIDMPIEEKTAIFLKF